jgi:hypothetical protein
MAVPAHPYSLDELKLYLKHKFVHLDQTGPRRPWQHDYKPALAARIHRYPGWMQVIIVEGEGRLFAGNQFDLNMLDHSGHYMPSNGLVAVLANHIELKPNEGNFILEHEFGHKVSYQAGKRSCDSSLRRKRLPLSSSPAWRRAFYADMAAHAAMPETDRRQLTGSLYPHAWDLKEHVENKLYRTHRRRKRPEEAVAEMVKHHAVLYGKYGDEQTSLGLLHRVYPNLAAQFAGPLMAGAAALADEHYTRRNTLVSQLTAEFCRINHAMGKTENLQVDGEREALKLYRDDVTRASILLDTLKRLNRRIEAGPDFDSAFPGYLGERLRKRFANVEASDVTTFLVAAGWKSVFREVHRTEMSIPNDHSAEFEQFDKPAPKTPEEPDSSRS